MAAAEGLEMARNVLGVRAALREMERTKVNLERAELGLPPLKSWDENLKDSIKAALRKLIFEICCSCCHYKRDRHLKKAKCRIFQDGTYPNCVLKSILGFVCAIIISYAFYFVMIYQLLYSPKVTATTCIIMATVLCLGLAFSTMCRCVTMLMFPTLCSKQGRSAILAYIFVLVVTHPVTNFRANVHVLSDSTTCGQEVGYNATKEIVDMAVAPANGIITNIRELIASLIELSNQLRDSFLKVRDLFAEIMASIRRTFEWLGNMVNICNDRMGQPYLKCKGAFDSAVASCRRAMGIMGFLCAIVNKIGAICQIARIGELLCHITARIVGYIKQEVTGKLTMAMQDIYDMFYFNVTLIYQYNLTVEQSKSFAEIREDIKTEVEDRLGPFTKLVSFSNFILVFTLGWMLMKALMYRRKYLSKDNYDNCYISWPLRDIDARLADKQKETVLPLNWKEKHRFVYTGSIILTKPERRKLLIGTIMLLVTFLHAGFYMVCDYGLYWTLSMLKHHMHMDLSQDVPAHVRMHVQGEGVLADIYRTMITKFDPTSAGADVGDTAGADQCLPHPIRPNLHMYKVIGGLFGISLLLVLCESYGLRLRHVIASMYYPGREEERAAWLVHHILQRRGGFLKHLRRKMRSTNQSALEMEKSSLIGNLAAKSQILNSMFRLLGYHRKYCLSCAAPGKVDDKVNFIHCENHSCTAVYCSDCFTDINNMCTVCMNPVDYGDLSDISEERDSSDDEPDYEEVKKFKAHEKRQADDQKFTLMLQNFAAGTLPKPT